MTLDLRSPLGLLFTLYGVLLIGYGWWHRGHAGARPVPMDLSADLVWGAVMLVLGVALLWSRARARRRPRE